MYGCPERAERHGSEGGSDESRVRGSLDAREAEAGSDEREQRV